MIIGLTHHSHVSRYFNRVKWTELWEIKVSLKSAADELADFWRVHCAQNAAVGTFLRPNSLQMHNRQLRKAQTEGTSHTQCFVSSWLLEFRQWTLKQMLPESGLGGHQKTAVSPPMRNPKKPLFPKSNADHKAAFKNSTTPQKPPPHSDSHRWDMHEINYTIYTPT